MRLLGKLLICILLFFVGSYLYSLYNEFSSSINDENVEQEKEFYTAHTAYLAKNNEPVNYNLPKNATNFKVLVYPIIDEDVFLARKDKPGLEKQIEYALNLSYAGDETQYKYSTEVKTYTHQITEESLQPFWLNDEQTVLLSRSLEFEVPKVKDVSFSLNSENVSAYLIRTYYQQRQSRNRISQRWQRMSSRRKENLLKYYPFDPDVISRSEINSLYKNAWSSVAPSAENDSNVNTISLFEYDERQDLIANSGIQFSNLDVYLPKSSKYTFKVYKEAQLNFSVQSLNLSDNTTATLKHKQENASIKTKTYTFEDLKQLRVKPGNYELSFSDDVSLQVETNAEDAHLELPNFSTSLYNLDAFESIAYAVKTLPNIKAFYKATFHTLDEFKSAKVRIELFAGNERLSSNEHNLNFVASEYLPFTTSKEHGLQSLSEAIEKTINVNEKATRVVISALDTPISIRLTNTVSGLSAIKRISDTSAGSYQNAWFVLKPEKALSFLRDNKISRYLNIGSNAIPAERVAQSFEKLRPLNSQRFKVVYYQDNSTIHSGNSGVSFRRLRKNGNNRISFNDKKLASKKTLKPTVIIRSRSQEPSNTELRFADKNLVLENTESVQEHLLPRTEIKRPYNLNLISANNQDVYVNYTQVGNTQLLKRQFFNANKTLKYKFYKKANVFESLSLHLLSNNAQQAEIKTSLLKNKRLIKPQKTSASRQFIFAKSDDTLTNSLLPSSDCRSRCKLFTPQFLPLYEDLSEGWYELHIEVPSRRGFFVDVNKTYYQSDSQSITFSDES